MSEQAEVGGSVYPRVNALEQEVSVLRHRVQTLEETPPRVNDLEQSVGVLKVGWDRMQTDISEVKRESHEIRAGIGNLAKAQQQSAAKIQSLFVAGFVLAAIAGAIVGAVNLYETALSIQARQSAAAIAPPPFQPGPPPIVPFLTPGQAPDG